MSKIEEGVVTLDPKDTEAAPKCIWCGGENVTRCCDIFEYRRDKTGFVEYEYNIIPYYCADCETAHCEYKLTKAPNWSHIIGIPLVCVFANLIPCCIMAWIGNPEHFVLYLGLIILIACVCVFIFAWIDENHHEGYGSHDKVVKDAISVEDIMVEVDDSIKRDRIMEHVQASLNETRKFYGSEEIGDIKGGAEDAKSNTTEP